MIEINLLPEDLRDKKRVASDWNNIVYFAKIGLIALILAHIALGLVYLGYKYKLNGLSKDWSRISRDNSEVLQLRKDMGVLRSDKVILDNLIVELVPWSEIWHKLSLFVPDAAWFRWLKITSTVLDMRGSILAISGNEIEILNNFLQSVRDGAVFRKFFDKVDIVSIVRNELFGVEIIDFSIKGILKAGQK